MYGINVLVNDFVIKVVVFVLKEVFDVNGNGF